MWFLKFNLTIVPKVLEIWQNRIEIVSKYVPTEYPILKMCTVA